MSEGNRLIEVLVLIVLFVIVIAILINSLLTHRTSHNELSAIASLKQIASAETLWYQQDPDGNVIKDYWTYDVSCLHRAYKTDNKTKVALIKLDIVRADIAPSDPSEDDPFGGMPLLEIWPAGCGVMYSPNSGYWFSVMITNNLTGQTDPPPSKYNVNPVGNGTISACNSTQFAFMAAPDVYGSSGIRSFIINEAGVIYGADTGAVGETDTGYAGGAMGYPGYQPDIAPIRWTTDGTTGDILVWPTKDPTTRKTKSGKPWKIVD